jgi:hypothetical protein
MPKFELTNSEHSTLLETFAEHYIHLSSEIRTKIAVLEIGESFITELGMIVTRVS